MRALAAFATFAALACGTQPRTPSDVVALYFASLGRDPMRTLPITTDAFHRAHGLDLITTAEARAWHRGALVEVAAPERVDRAQVAWLAIQNRPDFAQIASGLVTTREDVQEAGDVATVSVAVTPAHATPFVQTFRLLREAPASGWRIDAIEQRGIAPDNEMAAFVAHPTESVRRAIELRLRP